MRTCHFFQLLALSCLFPGILSGNGGGYLNNQGWSGDFAPRGLNKVEMLSENLEIRFGIDHAEVNVHYLLQNGDSPKSVRFGFPCTFVKFKKDAPVYGKDALALYGYQIAVNGKPVSSKEVEEKAPVPVPVNKAGDKAALKEWGGHEEKFQTWVRSWRVSEIKLGANQPATVQIRFSMPYSSSGYHVSDDSSHDPSLFSYTLSSAAAWKGPIKSGSVRLTVDHPYPEEFKIRAPSDRFEKEGNQYTWSFSNLEPAPADDLAIEVFGKSREYYRSNVNGQSGSYNWRGTRSYFEHTRYQVVASSQLGDDGEINYQPDNIKKWEGAWVEGVTGDGIGEKLTLTPDFPTRLDHIVIKPGYDKSTDLWLKNNRVALLKVRLNEGEPFEVKIPDSPAASRHWFPVNLEEPVRKIELEIAGVHRGAKYRDTCISNVSLVSRLDKRPKIQGAR